MKPDKSLNELLESVRGNVVKAYKTLQTQDVDGLSKVASELSMQNFSVSWYVAEYDFEAKSLEAEYKRQMSVTYMSERSSGATEKNAEATARQKWFDMHKKYLTANKAYRLAKSTHDDVQNLLDIMRSRIGILRLEIKENK